MRCEKVIETGCVFLLAALMCVAGCSETAPPADDEADCTLGCWDLLAQAPRPRQELQPASLDGKVYLVGGLNGTDWSDVVVESSVDVYDPDADAWDTVAPLPVARHHIAVAAAGGRLYAAGGMSGDHFSRWEAHADLFEYDPGSDTWQERASMPSPRGEHLALSYGGKIYFIGGRDANGDDTGANETYDPISDSWEEVAPMPTPRRSFAAAVLDTLVYVVGGRHAVDASGALVMTKIVEAYAPESDAWYRLEDLPTARAALALGSVSGKLFAMGGESLSSGGSVFSTNREYDPAADSWRTVQQMLTPVHGTGAVTVSNDILVLAGGTRAAVYSSSVAQRFWMEF